MEMAPGGARHRHRHGHGAVLVFLLALVSSTVTVVTAAVPTAAITAPTHLAPTKATTFDLVVTFSEKVSGFGDSGIPTELEITGGSFILQSLYTSDGIVYNLKVSPSTTQGTLRVVATAGAGTSVSTSQASVKSATFELAYDLVKPTVTFTPSTTAAPSRVSPIPFTFKWDEPVTGFEANPPGWLSRVTVSGGYVTSSSVNATSSTYSLVVVPVPAVSGAKTGTISIAIVAGVAKDAAQNANDALTYTHSYDYDPPSPSITSTVANPTRTNPIPVVIEWKEPVTPDITLANLDITGQGTATNFRKLSDGKFALDLVPTFSAASFQVKVKPGAVTDAAGNKNDGTAMLPSKYDTVAPTATGVGVLGGHLPTSQNPITLDFNFSEAVTQFSAGGVTVMSGGGTVTGVASVSGTSDRYLAYLAAPVNSTGGTIQFRLAPQAVLDLAGNKNGVGSVVSVTYDYSKPTLTMRVSASSAEKIAKTPGVPIIIEIESNEILAGDLKQMSVVGQRALMATFAAPLKTVTSKRKYTVGLLPGDPSPGVGQGEAAAVVVAGAVSDVAGNGNARTEFRFKYDFAPPKPTMKMTDGDGSADRTARTVVPFVLDFGEAVDVPTTTTTTAGKILVGFFAHNATDAQIDAAPLLAWRGATLSELMNGTGSSSSSSSSSLAGGLLAVSRAGPGNFSVNVTVPTSTVGKLTRVAFRVQRGVVADVVGHLSEEGKFQSVTHDSMPPVVTFITQDNWRVTNANPISFTFEMDEPVLGISSADVEVYGGTLVPGSLKTVVSSPTPARMASMTAAGGMGPTTGGIMVPGTGSWGRRFTFSAAPSIESSRGELTVEVRRRAARDQSGVDIAVAVRQTLAFDYVRPRVISLSEVKGATEAFEYLGGYKDRADVLKTLVVVEITFDEAVEKVNASKATVIGGGGVVYSEAKVTPGTRLANFTAGVASRRWRFLVLLNDAHAEKRVKLGEGAGYDLAGNPSMAAAGEGLRVPSAATFRSSAAGGRFGDKREVVLRAIVSSAAACVFAIVFNH